jgi:hypothetical protein
VEVEFRVHCTDFDHLPFSYTMDAVFLNLMQNRGQ